MSIRIASFNIRDFSPNRKDIDFLAIANIIYKANYDIVAIQEVLKEEAVKILVDTLNRISRGIWKSSVEKPEQGNPTRKESFAFIWNEKRVVLAKQKKVINGKLVEEEIRPYIINDYNSAFKTRLERNPLYGRFWPKEEDYSEIRLIDVHIKSPRRCPYCIGRRKE